MAEENFGLRNGCSLHGRLRWPQRRPDCPDVGQTGEGLAKTLAKQEKAVEKALPSKFKNSVLRGPPAS